VKRRLITIFTFMVGITSATYSATLSDVKILEASGNIKYLTQKIAKDYLYLYTYPKKQNIYTEILEDVKTLEKNIRNIAVTTKDEKIKYILDFFAYEKEQIKLTLKEKISNENANKVLDFSEALTEGAENIVNSIQYTFTPDEKMFMRSKNIKYQVEKLAKYYMVLESDIDKTTINEKLKQTVDLVDKDLNVIQKYTYPKVFDQKKQAMAQLWDANKHYYSTVNKLKIPTIVLLSTNGLQSIIDQIAIHHAKGE